MSARPAAAVPQIRAMRPADLDAVMAIETRNYRFPWGRGIFSDCLMAGYCCAVLEIDGRVRGYAILSSAAAEAHVLNLCVDPDYQGRGFGHLLLHHLLQQVQEIAVQRLFLEVRPSNAPALALYRKHGFQRIGVRKAYYQSPGDEREDAWVFMRDFSQTAD